MSRARRCRTWTVNYGSWARADERDGNTAHGGPAMRLAWVQGRVTLGRKAAELKPGALLICEALDERCLADAEKYTPRKSPMPESLVVFDHLGAGVGDLIAVSEGGEATQPFRPEKVPIDAYNAAIIDRLTIA